MVGVRSPYKLESVQRRVPRVVWELEHMKEKGSWVPPYWGGRSLGGGGVIAIFNSLMWTSREGRARFFAHRRDQRQQTQVSTREVPAGMVWTEANSHWELSERSQGHGEAGRYPSLEGFRAWLEKAQCELIWIQGWFCFEQGFEPDNLQRSLPA